MTTNNSPPHETTYPMWREQERARLRVEYPDAEGVESCLATAFTTWVRHLEQAALAGITLRRQVLDSMAHEYARPGLLHAERLPEADRAEARDAALRRGEGCVLAFFGGRAEPGRTGWIPPTIRKAERERRARR